MALFKKPDLSPSLFSKNWFLAQVRPNMLIYCQHHIVSILSSGLLFREDSLEVEQQASTWVEPETLSGPWFTPGERVLTALSVCAAFALYPPRSLTRWAIIRSCSYVAVPMGVRLWHRSRSLGSMRELLLAMSDYLAVARRSAACCREYAALHAKLASVQAVVESTQALLLRQQSDLVNILSRCSSSILGNTPWIRGDVDWEAVCEPRDSLMKIHHTFLVVQSLLLKHLCMVHYPPRKNPKEAYKSHNERIYWIHYTVLPLLITEYKDYIQALERLYRLLKNCAVEDTATAAKKLGAALNNVWTYAEVHTDVARTSLELKIALNTSNEIDRFLDSCAMNRVEVDLDLLDRDMDELVEYVTKALTSAQNGQKRVTKLRALMKPEPVEEEETVEEEVNIVQIDDKDPEIKDEVFYCVKEEDDEPPQEIGDITTGPGKKEKENSKLVLNELKRKLVKREDMMRERERQALKKTMPLEQNVPEFPRQIDERQFDNIGFINKIRMKLSKPKKHFINLKSHRKRKPKIYKKKAVLIKKIYYILAEIPVDIYVTLLKRETVTVFKVKRELVITRWRKHDFMESWKQRKMFGEGSWAASVKYEKPTYDAYKCKKEELELSSSEPEDDWDGEYEEIEMPDNRPPHERGKGPRVILLRKTRSLRNAEAEEDLKPIEYSFGAGMAMAAVLQGGRAAPAPALAQEQLFVGDGALSDDSGNEPE